MFKQMSMNYFILFVTVFPGVFVTRSVKYFCYLCDDGSDNTDCQTITNCYAPEEVSTGNASLQLSKCMTRIYFQENGLILQKACANPQMCEVHEKKNIDGCENPDEEFEGLCSYCCDTPGCNKDLPPYNVKQQKRKRSS